MPDSRQSVLLVEDESLIRLVLAAEFEDGGFEVHEAGSADQAVALLEAGLEVMVVVTDVLMPGSMDGLGLAAWLAQRRPGLPVVIVSGYAMQPEVTHLNPAVVAVLPKPYNPVDIVALIAGPMERSPA